MSRFVFTVFITCLLINVGFCRIQCKDENNNDVDWFVAYKLPKNTRNSNDFVKDGLAYVFITSRNVSNLWQAASVSINDSNSILGYTLQGLYEKHESFVHYLYNDQPPEANYSIKNGHSKGVLISDQTSGFWLIHSVPHFPPSPASSYSYPKTGTHFGQSFLCVSLSLPNIDAVAGQLMYVRPLSYSYLAPEESSMPNLSKLVKGEYITTAPFWKEKPIHSLNGMLFKSFTKTSKFHKDLYVDWVAQALQDDLLVETWPNGPGRLPSNCSLHYRVNNVMKIQIPIIDIAFSEHVDHSKWAVTSNQPWICIGGINRAEEQKSRGGGTLCFQSSHIWGAYRRSIIEIEPCI